MKKVIFLFLLINSIGFGQVPFFISKPTSEIDTNKITINTQIFAIHNLHVTKYNDGIDIPLVTDATAWAALTTPAYCWYNNDISYKWIYGALYNWYAINTGKLCPAGWHIPTYDEREILTTYLGGVSVSGGKMKETGTSHWASPNTGASNTSGFTDYGGGYRLEDGTFTDLKNYSYLGNSNEYNSTDFYIFGNDYLGTETMNMTGNKKAGVSIRCVKD